ncbi:MAG TPA: response regulator receiver protein, partial [Brevundimonas sp.]|nr:response regulator receiver protein [Brevundimonas sp.]
MPTIEKLTERATPVPPETLGAAIFAHFKDFPDALVIPVVKDDRPVGLIERNAFLLKVAGPFGHALYGNRPITELMDDEPSVVEAGVRIDSFCDAMLSSGPGALTRGFIVTRKGKYWGIGTVISLLKAINDDQRRQNAELTEQARMLSDT